MSLRPFEPLDETERRRPDAVVGGEPADPDLFDALAAQLFGEQPDVLDAVPVLGQTVEQVKQIYGPDLTGQGRDLILTLPPTEWERTATKITLAVQAGRVRELAFAVPFKANPPAREALLELFTHKWGAPRPSEDEGKPILVFRDGQPRVEVREDPEHDAWKLEIR